MWYGPSSTTPPYADQAGTPISLCRRRLMIFFADGLNQHSTLCVLA
jgi:hypothetical protein